MSHESFDDEQLAIHKFRAASQRPRDLEILPDANMIPASRLNLVPWTNPTSRIFPPVQIEEAHNEARKCHVTIQFLLLIYILLSCSSSPTPHRQR